MVLQLKKREIYFLIELLRLRMFEITKDLDDRYRDDERMSLHIIEKLSKIVPQTH